MRVGWGGKRIGSGRKKQHPALVITRRAPAPVLAEASPALPAPPVETFDPPDDVQGEARAVWISQAPHAFQQRTLTRASALAFARYCQIVVLERNEAKSSGLGSSNHRGLIKIVQSYELQFLLSPSGRPMIPAETAPAVPDANDVYFGVGPGARRA